MTQPAGTVTIMFTDLVGSTALGQRLGDDEALALRRAHDRILCEQFERFGGRVVKGTGDGFMVAFGSARQGVECGAAVQRAIEALTPSPSPGAGGGRERMRVRIGLHTGEPTAEGGDLRGTDVDLAARITDEADGGQVLVSELTRSLARRAAGLTFEPIGERMLKGFTEPVPLFAVRWPAETPRERLARFGGRTPFVGRQQEMEALKSALEEAVRGGGSLWMLVGEPGIGKTRLCQELSLHAESRGARVLVGRCTEAEGSPPYLPFVEALEAIIAAEKTDALRERLGEDAPIIAKLVPQVRSRLPRLPKAPQLPPDSERYVLFQAVTGLLRGTAQGSGLLLVLEDLHWADKPSLLLLQHLARHLGDSKLLVVGTYRDIEVDASHPLSALVADLRRERLFERIDLKGLPPEDVRALITAVGEQETPEAFARALHQQTEGNPFFVEEVLRHLVQEGVIYRSEAGWASDLTVEQMPLPEGVKEAIGRRLARLSDACHGLLRQAAVLGREFRHDLLARLAGISSDELLAPMEEALDAVLVQEPPGRETTYTFTHALCRQTLLEELSLARRRRLHLQAAEAIEAAYPTALEEHAAELAYHLTEAGELAEPERAVRYSTLAGDRALESAAFEEAARHFVNAIRSHPVDDRRGIADLLNNRGLALRSLGRWEEALTDWREALDIYEALGESGTVGRLCREIAQHLIYGARFLEGVEISRRGLIALGEQASADRCSLLAMAGTTIGAAGQYDTAHDMIGEAVAIGEHLGDPELLGRALVGKAWFHFYYQENEQQLESARRAIELLRLTGDLGTLANAMAVMAAGLGSKGRMAEAEKIYEEGEALALRLGLPGPQANCLAGRRCITLCLAGDLEGLEDMSHQFAEVTRNMPGMSLLARYFLGITKFLKGRWAEAEVDFESIRGTNSPAVGVFSQLSQLFLLHAYSGRREEAMEMFRQASGLLPLPGQAIPQGRLLTLFKAVEGLAVLGEREEAAKLYPLVVEAMRRTGITTLVPMAEVLVESCAGIAAACGRQWEKAQEHYLTALRQADEMPNRIAQPEVRRWYAKMLIERRQQGDRRKARQLLSEAIAMYREIGMPKHVEMAEAMLAKLGPAPVSAAPLYPDSLTEREVEVLRLIAAGKSNSEIAEALVLSLRTVERHITNIYGKIGAHGKADATRYALEHGLK